MKKTLLITLGLAFAGTASAETSSEFWYQPTAGSSALSVGLNSTSSTVNLSGGVESKTTNTGMPFQLKYAYGLDSNMSFSVGTDVGNEESETSGTVEKSTGLGDLRAEFLMGNESWFYGAGGSVALSKAKEATSSVSGNRSSGGYSLAPFVGYVFAPGFGGKASYTFLMDRTIETSTVDKVRSGGNSLILEGYWEVNYGSGIFGAKVGFGAVGEVTTTQEGSSDSKINSYNAYSVGAYIAHSLTANGAVLGNIDYAMVPKFAATSDVDLDLSGFAITAAYRMGF